MRDFADCSALTEALSDQDAAIFCLGAYTGAVTDTELRTITFYPAFQVLFPNHVIRADDLARAMVEVVVRGTDERGGLVFENHDIRAIVESIHPHTGGPARKTLERRQ
jgi:hypothetical protein